MRSNERIRTILVKVPRRVARRLDTAAMRNRLAKFSLVVVVTAFVGCQPPPAAGTYAPRTPHSPAWSAEDALPQLLCRQMLPIKDRERFRIDSSAASFRRSDDAPKPPSEKPYERDDQAIATAKAWLVEHFGPLDEHVTLSAFNVDRSASGRPEPVYDWDIGHTISFRVSYRGIPTDSGVTVYIVGRTVNSASVELYTYEPIAGTEARVVSKEAAVQAWCDLFAKNGTPIEKIEEFKEFVKPSLEFSWYYPPNEHLRDTQVIVPTWVVHDDMRMMVDGHSGKAWHND